MPRRLQDELRQTRPFASPAHEASLAILRTADRLRRHGAALLEGHGLTLQQYNVLRILRGAQGPLPTLEIAARMLEQAPGITRLLDRLEQKGLVRREPCPTDRRQVLIHGTPAALAVLAELDPVMARTGAVLGEALTEGELATLVRLLASAREALAGALGEG